jgi:hypothetical protein
LDFASEFFALAFGLQVGVVRDLSGLLLNIAFQFMKLAFDLILRARFYWVSPLLFRELPLKLLPVFGKVSSALRPGPAASK